MSKITYPRALDENGQEVDLRAVVAYNRRTGYETRSNTMPVPWVEVRVGDWVRTSDGLDGTVVAIRLGGLITIDNSVSETCHDVADVTLICAGQPANRFGEGTHPSWRWRW